MNLNRNPRRVGGRPGGGWIVVCWLVFCCFPGGCARHDKQIPDRVGNVGVAIDYNGRKPNSEFELPNIQNATVLSVLQQALQANNVELDFRGEGEFAFIKAIGGVKNERAAGDNWNYRVNGQLGDRSCGVFQVKAGDQILWTFGKYP